MTDDSTDSVMRRKAGAGRPPPEIGRITTSTVLRVAVAQGAEDALGLVASATAVDESRMTVSVFTAGLPENALLILCENDRKKLGMVVLDQECFAALIEMQTMGRVVSRQTDPRPPTRTDALLCADFIDQILTIFEQGTAEAKLPIAPSVAGYRSGSPLADMRAIEMTLADCPYHYFAVRIDFSDGAKVGEMRILLPLYQPMPETHKTNTTWENDLAEVVGCTHVEIEAVLARKELPLAEVTALQVGSLITLPREVVSEVLLIDAEGRGIALGRLGQTAGMRAVCIAEPCMTTPDFTGPSCDAGLPAQIHAMDTVVDVAPMVDLEGSLATFPPNPASDQEPFEAVDVDFGMPDMENI